jgi:hypothetical protein
MEFRMKLVLSDEDDEESNCVKTWRWLVLARCNFVAVVNAMMETEFLYAKTVQLTAEKTKEEYFGFHAREVSYIHHHRLGRPHGLYFVSFRRGPPAHLLENLLKCS